jgi:hypothetical protein
MEIFAMAIMFVGGIWGAIYLIMNDHPWFGLFVLIITDSLRRSSRRTTDAADEKDAPDEISVPLSQKE